MRGENTSAIVIVPDPDDVPDDRYWAETDTAPASPLPAAMADRLLLELLGSGSGSTVWDSSGRGFHGTMLGTVTPADGKIGTGFRTDPSGNGHILVANRDIEGYPSTIGNVLVSYWFYGDMKPENPTKHCFHTASGFTRMMFTVDGGVNETGLIAEQGIVSRAYNGYDNIYWYFEQEASFGWHHVVHVPGFDATDPSPTIPDYYDVYLDGVRVSRASYNTAAGTRQTRWGGIDDEVAIGRWVLTASKNGYIASHVDLVRVLLPPLDWSSDNPWDPAVDVAALWNGGDGI